MTSIETHGGREPGRWYLLFHVKPSGRWWLDALSRLGGEFRHVSAFGYEPGHKVWLLQDVNFDGVQTVLYSDEGMKAALSRWLAEGASLVLLPEERRPPMGLRSRLGLWCVTGAAHITRTRGFALTPTGLYNLAICNGGKLVSGSPSSPDRSGAASRAAAGG